MGNFWTPVKYTHTCSKCNQPFTSEHQSYPASSTVRCHRCTVYKLKCGECNKYHDHKGLPEGTTLNEIKKKLVTCDKCSEKKNEKVYVCKVCSENIILNMTNDLSPKATISCTKCADLFRDQMSKHEYLRGVISIDGKEAQIMCPKEEWDKMVVTFGDSLKEQLKAIKE